MGSVMEEKRAGFTYTVHIQIGADTDEEAARLAHRIVEDLSGEFGFLPESPNGYKVDSLHVTDADDWGEHVDIRSEGLCGSCMRTAKTERQRNGTGKRVCVSCLAREGHVYQIVNVTI